MGLLRDVGRHIAMLARGRRFERDLEDEMRLHLELEAARQVERGVSPADAPLAARRAFGRALALKEDCRDAWGWRWLDDLRQDLRYAVRVLRRSPTFAMAAMATLALGIGANTAIFSLLDRVTLRMMSVREPEGLVQITRFHGPQSPAAISYPMFQTFSRELGNFDGLLAHWALGVRDITIDGDPEPADFDLVSGSYYPLLGVNAALGQTFGEEVDRALGSHAVAVISHRYWERRFASDPGVVGKTFRRLDTLFTIVGVAPPQFFGTVVGKDPDITVPLTMDAQVRGGESWLSKPTYSWLSVMGRLKRGRVLRDAQAEANTTFGALAAAEAAETQSETERRGRLAEHVELTPGGNGFDDLRRRVAEPLTILMGIVALLLLLACANLANLLLARSASRQREIAVRLAMGAGRGRVARQLLTEGLLLAFMGGTIGVWLAYLLAEGLVTMMSNSQSRIPLDVRPDGRVVLFALATSVVACLLFSLAPVFHATRESLQPALAERQPAQWRLGKGLVVAQMAISVLLLIGAGLFGRTLINMYSLDPGFDRHGVVLFSTNAARNGYSRDRIQELQDRMPVELDSLPGIQSASVSMFPPISGGGWDGSYIVEGHVPSKSENDLSHINSVGPDFFKTFHTAVVAGREFNERDTATSPRVVVVNQTFAKYYFPNQSPLGRWVAFEGPERDSHYQIVGVVADAKYESLRHDFPRTVYMMTKQVPPGPDSYTFAVRTAGGMAAAAPAIEGALRRLDPALRAVNVISLEEHVARSLLQERMLATLAGCFGALALLLSAVGIYGTMAFQVARRRREIGIRMALGANARSVMAMVLGQTARLTITGCLIGATAGLALTRVAKTALYGIGPTDPLTFGAAISGLLVVALAAAYLPGLSAARTNPVDTLRAD